MKNENNEWNDEQYRWLIRFFVATIPVIILLTFFWFAGTSTSQYWDNFEEIEGEIVGPYSLIEIHNKTLLYDSIIPYLAEYNQLEDSITNLGFKADYDSIYYPFWKFRLPTQQVDSLGFLSKTDWDELKITHEKITKSVDTLLVSDTAKFRLKIKNTSKIYVSLYFSIKGHPSKFSISEFIPTGEDSDLMHFVYEYGGSGRNGFSNWEELEAYSKRLEKIIGNNTELSITKLKSDKKISRSYIIEAGWNNELYTDEYGFDALKAPPQKNRRSRLLELKGEVNMDFVLWYDNWIVKFLLVFEIFLILRVIFKIRQARD